MKVRIVQLSVHIESIDAFEDATLENQHNSLLEPGIVRFDLLRDEQTPGLYTLYELYSSSEAILAHKETAHYQKWRDTVAPMMQEPRVGRDLMLVLPRHSG